MQARVIKLASGLLSLEFPAGYISEVKRIAEIEMGGVQVRRRADYDVVTIRSCELLSEVEYDEASMLSTSEQCNEVIRELYRRITGRISTY